MKHVRQLCYEHLKTMSEEEIRHTILPTGSPLTGSQDPSEQEKALEYGRVEGDVGEGGARKEGDRDTRKEGKRDLMEVGGVEIDRGDEKGRGGRDQLDGGSDDEIVINVSDVSDMESDVGVRDAGRSKDRVLKTREGRKPAGRSLNFVGSSSGLPAKSSLSDRKEPAKPVLTSKAATSVDRRGGTGSAGDAGAKVGSLKTTISTAATKTATVAAVRKAVVQKSGATTRKPPPPPPLPPPPSLTATTTATMTAITTATTKAAGKSRVTKVPPPPPPPLPVAKSTTATTTTATKPAATPIRTRVPPPPPPPLTANPSATSSGGRDQRGLGEHAALSKQGLQTERGRGDTVRSRESPPLSRQGSKVRGYKNVPLILKQGVEGERCSSVSNQGMGLDNEQERTKHLNDQRAGVKRPRARRDSLSPKGTSGPPIEGPSAKMRFEDMTRAASRGVVSGGKRRSAITQGATDSPLSGEVAGVGVVSVPDSEALTVGSAQLLEMELRRRALEAELRRNNANRRASASDAHQPDRGEEEEEDEEGEEVVLVEKAKKGRKEKEEEEEEEKKEAEEGGQEDAGVSGDDSLSERGDAMCEDAISLHPEFEGSEEGFGGREEVESSSGRHQEGGRGLLKVEEMLEERLRQRALQAMVGKKKKRKTW